MRRPSLPGSATRSTRKRSIADARRGMNASRCAWPRWNVLTDLHARRRREIVRGMFPQHLIARKRDGHALSREEIGAFVRGATDGSWADYQLSALLMAIFLRGMNDA